MCRRILSALLAGLLLIPLAACAPEEGPAAEETPSPSPTATGSPRPTPSLRPSATPEPEPDLSWDEDHTLDRDFTPAAGGKLELPVRGATGYAPVEMGLWPEPQPDPEPEPSPSPEPAGTEPPPADPSPAPSEPVESAPADSPAPTAPGESPPAESGTPADPAPSPAPPPESASPETTPAPAESPAPSPEASPSPAPTPAPSPEPSPEPSATPSPTPSPSADPFEGALMVLEPGTAFTILKEEGDWWQVRCRGETGWVDHRICFINLPDVVPSILYDATNSYDSLYRSAGKALSGVTGESLYPGMTYNPRLGRSEFMMPVLYAMAYRICEAQQAALSEGNSLVIYEAYRPYSTQRAVVKALTALIRSDPEVDAAVNRGPWGPGNFIAMGYSNHQRGFAMDVSLAKVWSTREEQVGDYTVLQVVDYDLYEMPTPMHELSADAVTFTRPTGAWRTAEPAPGMNDPAFALQRYCTDAGMTPLSSEWWHFNDYAALELADALPAPPEGSQPVQFQDTRDHWARDYIARAAQSGLVGGVGTGLFSPDTTITRQEIMVILDQALDLPDENGLDFDDTEDIAVWALPAAARVTAAGLMTGAYGQLLPGAPCTRAEAAAMVKTLLSSDEL